MTSNAEVLKGIFSNTLPSVLFHSHTPLQEDEQMAQKFSHDAIATRLCVQHHAELLYVTARLKSYMQTCNSWYSCRPTHDFKSHINRWRSHFIARAGCQSNCTHLWWGPHMLCHHLPCRTVNTVYTPKKTVVQHSRLIRKTKHLPVSHSLWPQRNTSWKPLLPFLCTLTFLF